MHLAKEEKVCSIIDDVISNSALLSADVSAAVDPNYKEAHDLSNAPRLGYGITLMKYTGSGGKSRTNDANAELLAKVRNLFNKEDISWQVGELGKVDRGGGGTIALFFAEKGLDVLDAGVPLLGMHSPYEIASKRISMKLIWHINFFLKIWKMRVFIGNPLNALEFIGTNLILSTSGWLLNNQADVVGILNREYVEIYVNEEKTYLSKENRFLNLNDFFW